MLMCSNACGLDSKLNFLFIQVEQALREWMSFDSLRVVLGDKYVRGMLEHIGQTWDDYDTTSG